MFLRHVYWKAFARKYKLSNVDGTPVKVTLIEPDACCTYLKLGMTEDRAKELTKSLLAIYNTKSDIVEVIEAVSVECKHANELAFCMLTLVEIHSARQNPLQAIMGMMRRSN